MEMAKNLFQFRRRRPSYEPLTTASEPNDVATPRKQTMHGSAFSWVEYGIFLLLGIAMLWAWNMFLAAAPYFQQRFRSSEALLANFQATELSVSTLSNLGCMLVLTKLQANASYPRRIATSLIIYIAAYALLATSTKAFTSVPADGYFVFFVIMVFCSSVATGFMQNGSFAFASGFARPEYMQAIMTGQGIAGILPPIVQMVSVLSAGEAADEGPGRKESFKAAFAYFMTAAGISALTFLAFLYLVGQLRQNRLVETAEQPNRRFSQSDDASPEGDARVPEDPTTTKSVALRLLARKLVFPASAVFFTFSVTMVFPVFTQEITSINPLSSPLLRDAAFIPLAFLVWNAGDLLGRLVPLVPGMSLALRPKVLLLLALLRIVFIPLYFL